MQRPTEAPKLIGGFLFLCFIILEEATFPDTLQCIFIDVFFKKG